MATNIKLIYCADGNARFAEIALSNGFLYGSQMPKTVYFPPHFVDLDPNKLPKQPDYINALRKHRPFMASVHDWTVGKTFEEIMMRAEEIAQYVAAAVVIIPKIPGTTKHLPKTIAGKQVILGYSVPTSYGKTEIPLTDFKGWQVHLLGGSPHRQKSLANDLTEVGAEVASLDINSHQMMARRYCAFYYPPKYPGRGYWPTLKEFDGQEWGDKSKSANAPYEAFRRSCIAIREMWQP